MDLGPSFPAIVTTRPFSAALLTSERGKSPIAGFIHLRKHPPPRLQSRDGHRFPFSRLYLLNPERGLLPKSGAILLLHDFVEVLLGVCSALGDDLASAVLPSRCG